MSLLNLILMPRKKTTPQTFPKKVLVFIQGQYSWYLYSTHRNLCILKWAHLKEYRSDESKLSLYYLMKHVIPCDAKSWKATVFMIQSEGLWDSSLGSWPLRLQAAEVANQEISTLKCVVNWKLAPMACKGNSPQHARVFHSSVPGMAADS